MSVRRVKVVAVALGIALTVSASVWHFYSVSVKDQKFDWGPVVGKTSLDHVFIYPNLSLKEITIKSVQTSCGCTVVEELPKRIAPLSVLRVPVHMDVTQKSGKTSSVVTLIFVDETTASFQMTSSVYPPLPDKIDFGKFKRGDRPSRVYMLDADRLKLASCGYKGLEGVDVRLDEILGKPVIYIDISPELKLTREFSFNLPFECEDLEVPPVTIRGYVQDVIEAKTPLLSFGYVTRRESDVSVSRVVEFFSPYGEFFKWDEAATPGCDTATLAAVDASGKRIKITLAPQLPEGLVTSNINVHFTLENSEKTIVPLTLYAYVTSANLYAAQ